MYKRQEKQSSAIIVHKTKRTATSTRTIRTRQNKPYRLGAAPAGVIGARGRCCPAATVPVSVVLPCGVCCSIAEIAEKKQGKSCVSRVGCRMASGIVSDLSWYQKLSAVRSKLFLHEYENNTHEVEQALPAWRGAGRSSRGTRPLLSTSCLLYTSPSPRD